MAEQIKIRLPEGLETFVAERSGEKGLYGSASEYLADLVRRDYEREEQRRWEAL